MTMKTAYLAGGCFWGLEDLFRAQPGVTDTEVGYAGGQNANPTYQSHPGHAETLAITYDPTQTSFEALLDFFFRIHDPTTRNRQGNDVGSSYRSAIFYQRACSESVSAHPHDGRCESGLLRGPVRGPGSWLLCRGVSWRATVLHHSMTTA